jgi:putative membrane protein
VRINTKNSKNLVHHTAVIAFVLVFGFVLLAARKANPQTASAPNPDHLFAKKAASGGMSEVKLGQLAQDKGSNPAVKEFGERMVTDHSKANDELKGIASRDNLNLPSGPSKTDEAEYDRLSKLSGKQFDDAYAKMMVSDHEKDIAEFRKESTSGQDPALKSFASKTLPTLESHLQQAKQMLKSVQTADNRM